MDLRYGMNPHQAARTVDAPGAAPVRVVSGTPSYINLLDALSAWQLVREASGRKWSDRGDVVQARLSRGGRARRCVGRRCR